MVSTDELSSSNRKRTARSAPPCRWASVLPTTSAVDGAIRGGLLILIAARVVHHLSGDEEHCRVDGTKRSRATQPPRRWGWRIPLKKTTGRPTTCTITDHR